MTWQREAIFLRHANQNSYAIEVQGPGIPALKPAREPKPWEGLSCLVSETMGSVLTRDVFGRRVKEKS